MFVYVENIENILYALHLISWIILRDRFIELVDLWQTCCRCNALQIL